MGNKNISTRKQLGMTHVLENLFERILATRKLKTYLSLDCSVGRLRYTTQSSSDGVNQR